MIGRIINNYRVETLLGQGGMGQVYLAKHPIIGRKAAVKVLRSELAQNEILVARFMNEARAANAIGHPSIIDIIDAGILPEDGIPFLLMEFLEGESLAARLDRGHCLDIDSAVDFTSQTASALEAAHAKGIVHRDLKPDNLYIVPDRVLPRGERVKVLDFGIAKLRDDVRGDSLKTKSGSVLGTATYMSPEQCQGLVELIDHRSDIYSLGIILYECLTGTPPFVCQGFGDLVIAHMTRVPADPREANPTIPEHVAGAILRTLNKRPDDRFTSMAEFRATLTSTGNGSAVSTFQSPAPDAPPRSPNQRKWAADTTLRRSAVEAIEEAEFPVRATPYKLYGAIAAGVAVLGTLLLILLTRPSVPEKETETHAAARSPKHLPIKPILIEKEPEDIPSAAAPVPGKAEDPPAPKHPTVSVPGASGSTTSKREEEQRHLQAKGKPALPDKKKPHVQAEVRSPEVQEDDGSSPERW